MKKISTLVQAATEYLAEYSVAVTAQRLKDEFNITEEFALEMCERARAQMEFAYCGA